ncbi:hypothetical protein HZB00_00600 [Candidatus Woesearchaeota archaeon]|nr:hypothetical protein [Candidatus Woesearchaeota archaeon]
MDVLEYYQRKDVQAQLLKIAKERECQAWFKDIRGKRPDAVHYMGDVHDLVKQGMSSFHISEERWNDPLLLKPGMLRKDLDRVRLGWDCIIDLDSKHLPYSFVTAKFLLEALRFHDVKHVSLKFSGNHGFHIGIPFEAFPVAVNGIALKDYFPDGMRIIAEYLKELMREHISKEFLDTQQLSTIAKNLGKTKEELFSEKKFDPYAVVGIDSVFISSRHLFRAPYSINEKSGLVSIPLKDLDSFHLDDAKIENVKVNLPFLDREDVVPGEATQLLVQAFDWAQRHMQKKEERKTHLPTFSLPQNAISAEHFPSCVQKLLSGVQTDGRKRAVFILINFLRNVGWSFDAVEQHLQEWNKKNYEALPEGYIRSQISWFKRQSKIPLPPNCEHPSYYKAMGIYCGEQCLKCKNPVRFALQQVRNEQYSKKNK